jgi:hypothetical protein
MDRYHTRTKYFVLFILPILVLFWGYQGAAYGGSLLVSWNAVQDARVAGYKIKYGTTSGSYTQSLSVGNVTSSKLPGLTEGTTYYIVVVATDSAQVEGTASTDGSLGDGTQSYQCLIIFNHPQFGYDYLDTQQVQ